MSAVENPTPDPAVQVRMAELDAVIEQIELGMRPAFNELAEKAKALQAEAKTSERYHEVQGRYWKAYQKLLKVQDARTQRAIDEYRRLFIQCQSWERREHIGN